MEFSLSNKNNRWRSLRNLQFLAVILLDTVQQLWVEAEVTSFWEQTDEMKATRERIERNRERSSWISEQDAEINEVGS